MNKRRGTAFGVGFGFAAGLLLGGSLTALAGAQPFEGLRVFAEALAIIEGRYVEPREPSELVYDAIGGLTQGLDDHSIFLDPEMFREIGEQTSGEYFGVGVTVNLEEDQILVSAVLEDGPAWDAGIRAGDRLVAVDDVEVSTLGSEQALARVRGERGTVVVLTVERPATEGRLEFSVRRDRVRQRSVHARMLQDDVGYLQVLRFQRHTADEVRLALAELEKSSGRAPSALVVDVRGNPGGFLSQAVQIVDLWLAEGTIVSTVGRGPVGSHDMAHRGGADEDLRLAVLQDGGSASASEVLSGALKDHDRARVIGRTSYGKGSVQQLFDLSDGSALKLTTGRYMTPSGRSIHGSGVPPDLLVPDAEDAEGLAPLVEYLGSTGLSLEGLGADIDLQVALAWVHAPAEVEAWFAGRVLPEGPETP